MGNADAYGNVGPEGNLPYHSPHEFHEVVVLLVSVEIQELLVNGVALGTLHGLAHYALDPLGHCIIEHQVA